VLRKFGITAVLALLVTAFAAVPAMAAIVTDINPANAPQGTNLRTGTIGCSVGTDGLTVSCSTFELSGVGNANAQADLTATYSADVTCGNPAGGRNPNNPIEAQQTTATAGDSTGQLEPKNGRLRVPALDVSPADATLTPEQEAALCPNPGWDANIVPGSFELVSFTYTLTFVDANGDPLFGGAYITITGP
jgi:hypothetical protein